MNTFTITLINIAITLLFIFPGFCLSKAKKVNAQHLSSISSVLVYVCMPLMIISSFIKMEEFNGRDFRQMILFFIISLFIQILSFLLLYILLRKKFDDPKYSLLTAGSVFGNVGFFGIPLIRAILKDYPIAVCFSCVYTCSMNILMFTLGVFCITKDKKYVSLKSALINPPVLGIIIALPLYFTNASSYLPKVLKEAFYLLGDMTTPICMIILGVRLANCNFKKLFVRPIIYLTCLIKMLLFPTIAYLLVKVMPFSYEFRASLLILSSVPTASMVLNLSEIHHQEEELSANIVLLSTLLSLFTIPLVALWLYL